MSRAVSRSMSRIVTGELEGFFEMLAAERGVAANTLAAYRRDLAHLSAFLARPLAAAGSDDLRAYLAALQRAGTSRATTARRLSAMRQFFRFLAAEGGRADDPTAVLESPRAGRRLPKLLSEQQPTCNIEILGKGIVRYYTVKQNCGFCKLFGYYNCMTLLPTLIQRR